MVAVPAEASTASAARKNPLVSGLDSRLAPAQAVWPDAAQAPAAPVPVPPVGPLASLDFELPAALEAAEPPEARGQTRDAVRLMVSHLGADTISHARFSRLPDLLDAGDVLAINTSGTLNAALPAWRMDGSQVEVHLSTQLHGGLWTVELRQWRDGLSSTVFGAWAGESLSLPAGGRLTLYAPFHALDPKRVRLWVANLRVPGPLLPYLEENGFPIRYSYVRQAWPAAYYQTAYVTEPGSAEMPSAGRAFTPELITRLVARGVLFAPLLLHTGVASLEDHEPPYEEYYRVPAASARLINHARRDGQRVIAVGTTAVRALETVAADDGTIKPGEGWTNLVITPERKLRAVSGLLTGLHEPRASHLHMLTALAGEAHLRRAYAEALRQRYLWHEFGDLHLILP